MATTILEWVPKYIRQVVAYREQQAVSHERLNELFNLLIVQGDFNTDTLQTLINNLEAFDLQYLADMDANTQAHADILLNFTNTVNQIKQENATNIATLDTQQRQLMTEQFQTFSTAITESEARINADAGAKLAEVVELTDAAAAQYNDNTQEMVELRTTVENLRSNILADNQAIATQIQTMKTSIEQSIANAQGIVQTVGTINANIDGIRIYEVAQGAATELTLNVPTATNGSILPYISKQFIPSADNGGVATTINGIPVYMQGTTNPPKLYATKAATVWYSQTNNCFFLRASAEGDATAEHVLAPHIFSNGTDTGIPGTMVDNSAMANQTLTQTAQEFVIPKGYHPGTSKVTTNIINLTAPNVKAHEEVGGVVGSFTADGTATATQILAGKIAYVNGVQVAGTMPNRTFEATGGNFVAADAYKADQAGYLMIKPKEGYYKSEVQAEGYGPIVIYDPNFNPANFVGTIFGRTGTLSVGKKFASGTLTPTTTNSYAYFGGATRGFYSAIVSGLTFKPRVIVITNHWSMTVYIADSFSGYADSVRVSAYSTEGLATGETYYLNGNTAPAYVNATGFNLPLSGDNSTRTWFAYE